ncbi:hypothetical protein LCM28_25580 [Salipiger pacificus]|nr:hypothetical protein [Alloyangia pacifica]
MNKGLKRPVMHALVQFPPQVRVTEKSERAMLDAAVSFINETHGGQAVFAARLDRDEAGRHSVDVFYAPCYIKTTKARGDERWISTTKHGKELCQKHRDEIIRRSASGQFASGPRQVGMAMQSELLAFLRMRGLKLEQKSEKDYRCADRLEPEAYKTRRERELVELEKGRVVKAKRLLKKMAAKTRAEADKVVEDASRLVVLQMRLQAIQGALEDEVRTINKAVPTFGLGDKVKKRVADALHRMKGALGRLGGDLDVVGKEAGEMIDFYYDVDHQKADVSGPSLG